MPESFIPVWMSMGEAEEFRRFLQEEARSTDGEFPEREFELINSALEEERPRSFEQMRAECADQHALAEAVRAYFDAPSSSGVDRIFAALSGGQKSDSYEWGPGDQRDIDRAEQLIAEGKIPPCDIETPPPLSEGVGSGAGDLRAVLLDEDGPIFLTLREALGDAVDGYDWRDEDGDSLHPNDPAVEQVGDEICAAVKAKIDAAFDAATPPPQAVQGEACETCGGSSGTYLPGAPGMWKPCLDCQPEKGGEG